MASTSWPSCAPPGTATLSFCSRACSTTPRRAPLWASGSARRGPSASITATGSWVWRHAFPASARPSPASASTPSARLSWPCRPAAASVWPTSSGTRRHRWTRPPARPCGWPTWPADPDLMDRLPVPVMAPRETPAISFTFDRRPETATQVRLEAFEGPLALLLALIEQRQLDVLTVRLGDLAAAYLEALALLPGDRLPHLSTFVGVASQLILFKSRALLPRSPAPAGAAAAEGPRPGGGRRRRRGGRGARGGAPPREGDWRRRLVLYRVYRDAGLALRARLESGVALFHREPAAAYAAGVAGARPADEAPLDPALLAAAPGPAAQPAPPPAPPPGPGG